jgi:hypothetical protein
VKEERETPSPHSLIQGLESLQRVSHKAKMHKKKERAQCNGTIVPTRLQKHLNIPVNLQERNYNLAEVLL